MSINGEYLRVTAVELHRAMQDPDWAWDFVQEIQDADEGQQPGEANARHFSTYKTWDLLRFLLMRAEFPVDLIHGEEPFCEDADWGYGPPRYLRPEQVRLAAEALRATTYAQLIHQVAPAELTSAEVYPGRWDEPGSMEWGRTWYDGLAQYFEAAATADDAVLVWLD